MAKKLGKKHDRMDDEARVALAQVAKKADELGLCRHRSGNFSVVDHKTGHVLITPSGMARKELDPSHICEMDLAGNVVRAAEGARPSSETLMHLAVYEARPDVGAIVHTHSPYATAFACIPKPIPAMVYEFVYLGCEDAVKVVPYARPGTPELAYRAAAALTANSCCLLESHGAVCLGSNLEEAFLRAQYLEEIAHVYHIALTATGGAEPRILPSEELQSWAYPEGIHLQD